jgi:hypothetical protein
MHGGQLKDGMANELESVTPAGRELAGTVLEAFTRHRLVGIGGITRPAEPSRRAADAAHRPAALADIVVEFGNALPGHGGPVHSQGAGRRRRPSHGVAEYHAVTAADLGRAGLRAAGAKHRQPEGYLPRSRLAPKTFRKAPGGPG